MVFFGFVFGYENYVVIEIFVFVCDFVIDLVCNFMCYLLLCVGCVYKLKFIVYFIVCKYVVKVEFYDDLIVLNCNGISDYCLCVDGVLIGK